MLLPNIILILCDTLGAKHMSLYGYHRRTTPCLERLVEEDFTFYSYCFAPAPWTPPSHASLFTGLYPSQHRTDGAHYALNKGLLTLPQILHEMGYFTLGLSNNLLISKELSYNQGMQAFWEMWTFFPYEDFNEIETSLDSLPSSKKKFRYILNKLVETKEQKYIKFLLRKLGEKFIHLQDKLFLYSFPFTQISFDSLLKFIKESSSPFFIFCNVMETHEKFNPPRKFRNIFDQENSIYTKAHLKEKEEGKLHYGLKPLSAEHMYNFELLYDEEILTLDKLLFDFIKALRMTNSYENTIIIITSDHGEFTGENGHLGHLFTTANELIHVPLLIKWPQEYKMGQGNSNLVQLHDLYSTIMDIVNAPYPRPWSSFSLVSSEKRKFAIAQLLDVNFKLKGMKDANPNFTPKKFMQPVISVITDNLWKATKWWDGTVEIYDLNKGVYEKQNLAINGDFMEQIKKLKNLIEMLAEATNFNNAAVRPKIW